VRNGQIFAGSRSTEVSEEKISLELLGARVATLTAEVRDLQLRFGALEQRFSAMEARLTAIETRLGTLEQRFGAQEERMTRMLALIVRIAERLDGGSRG
jgi:chromosome segregation ATPase